MMNHADPRNDPRIDVLIDAYIDGTTDDDEFASLCDWLSEDAANRKTFARKLALHSEIAEWCIERSGESMAGNMDAAEDIAELPTIQTTASNTPTKQQYAAALSYVLRHTFTPKRVAVLASAAVLLLGVVLAIVILSGPGEDEPIAELPDVLWPSDEAPVAQRIVATLTAEHDAVWDSASAEGALAPGSALRAGDRLTLTQGFAEITTNNGAVAILEAPATIELLDSDNALRLHAGKLVGICETESSKGFLVRTAHMDITDLGTRFGVDVPGLHATEVHVIEGLVEVAVSTAGGEKLKLEKNQSVLAAPQSALQPIAFAPNRFVMDHELKARRTAAHSPSARSFVQRYESARSGGVLLDLSFEEDEASGVRATSIVNHDRPLVLKAEGLVPGRFGESTAVRLNGRDHFVQASIGQPLEQITIAGWYFIDALDHHVTSIVHGNAMSSLHWHITRGPNHTARIGMTQSRERGLRHWFDAKSDPIKQEDLTGRWMHLAMTLDSKSGEVLLYLNGERVAQGLADDFVPIALGEFQVGNWQPQRPVNQVANPVRALRGAVEEFVIINRSLSLEQVKELYRSSLP